MAILLTSGPFYAENIASASETTNNSHVAILITIQLIPGRCQLFENN